MRLRKGKIIPRKDGKRIVEWVGAATTGTDALSVARMSAPAGWSEPAQVPEFDEVVVVLAGTLTLRVDGKRERIPAGEVGLVPRGKRVTYANEDEGACDYYSICAPAFRPELAHVEAVEAEVEEPAAGVERTVLLEVAHPQGKPYAKLLSRTAERYLGALKLEDVELSLSLMGDRSIRRLNRTWRQKDQATDVLSFPADPPPRGTPGPRLLGDVVISLDTAKRNAREHGRPLEEELCRYLAHGLLHLLGHDHERSPAAARKMAKLEEQLLGSQGMVGDSLLPARPVRARKRS